MTGIRAVSNDQDVSDISSALFLHEIVDVLDSRPQGSSSCGVDLEVSISIGIYKDITVSTVTILTSFIFGAIRHEVTNYLSR
jgi:hypothetical protein